MCIHFQTDLIVSWPLQYIQPYSFELSELLRHSIFILLNFLCSLLYDVCLTTVVLIDTYYYCK